MWNPGQIVLALGVGLVVLIALQSVNIWAGCKMARIRRATFSRSMSVAVECILWNVLILPLLAAPIPTVIAAIVCQSILLFVPPGVIKRTYHVSYEQAFWASWCYLFFQVVGFAGAYLYARTLPFAL